MAQAGSNKSNIMIVKKELYNPLDLTSPALRKEARTGLSRVTWRLCKSRDYVEAACIRSIAVANVVITSPSSS